MTEIKSALEIALEKAERLGKASKEEISRLEALERGRRLAARFLKEKDLSLEEELKGIPNQELHHLLQGLEEVFVRNIVLPRDEDALRESIERALEGIKILKGRGPQIIRILQEIERLLLTYLQMKNDLYDRFRQQFQANMAGLEQAMAQQYGLGGRIEPESLPQFHEEWQKVEGDLRERFEQQLKQLKAALLSL
ncbi:DUF6657 family protein [Thermosulfuriphilus sp.]